MDNNILQEEGSYKNFHYDNEEELKFLDSDYQQKEYSNPSHPPKRNTYNQIMSTTEGGKNMSKNCGNAFKKFINSQFQDPQLKRRYKIKPPQKILDFCNKKKRGKQSMYNLSDFKNLFHDPESNKLIQFFLENIYFLDLLQSCKIKDPEQRIPLIENFISATKHPDKFIGNRTDEFYQAETKLKKKSSKQEEKKSAGLQIFMD